MRLIERLLWGMLAGLAIVLVKILSPDQAYVKSLFLTANAGELGFYAFISLATIALGALSGAFSNESDRVKLLLFCASVPALLSTATAERRDPIPGGGLQPTAGMFSVVTPANAQQQLDPLEGLRCDPGDFLDNFARTANNYLTGKKQTEIEQYSVVIGSAASLSEAKQLADRLQAEHPDFAVRVGCAPSGASRLPVLVGDPATQIDAAALLGEFRQSGKGKPSDGLEPYLLPDPRQKPVYVPTR